MATYASTARLPLIPLPFPHSKHVYAVPPKRAGGPVLFRLGPGRTYCTGCASPVIRPPRIYHIQVRVERTCGLRLTSHPPAWICSIV